MPDKNSRLRPLLPAILAAVLTVVVFFWWRAPVPAFIVGPGPILSATDLVQVGADADSDAPWLVTTVIAQPATVGGVLVASISGSEVLAWQSLVPPEHDLSSFRKLNERLMIESSHTAAYAALRSLGFEVSLTGGGAEVLAVWPHTLAAEVGLQANDIIVGVSGRTRIHLADDVHSALRAPASASAGQALFVKRADAVHRLPLPESVPPEFGAIIATYGLRADFGRTVRFLPTEVAGPSAGLAIALAIVDGLSPRMWPEKPAVAATGIVRSDGSIDPVGGVKHKAKAAAAAGAELFIVPEANLEEAQQAAPQLAVAGVRDLETALDVVRQMHEARSTSSQR